MKDFIGGLGFIENINQFHLHDLFKNTGGTLISPNTLSSIYQDSAGTTAGAVSQPIGLAQDQSGNGNDASQATSASRPTLAVGPRGGVRNLLAVSGTPSEDFSSDKWTRIGGATVSGTNTLNLPAPGDMLRFDYSTPVSPGDKFSWQVELSGEGTVRIGIVRAGGGVLEQSIEDVTLTPTPTLYDVQHEFINGHTGAYFTVVRSISGGSTATEVTITAAQLEVGDTPTNYQQVISATEAHEAGVPDVYSMRFDAMDDYLTFGTGDIGTRLFCDETDAFCVAGVFKFDAAGSGTTRTLVGRANDATAFRTFQFLGSSLDAIGLVLRGSNNTLVEAITPEHFYVCVINWDGSEATAMTNSLTTTALNVGTASEQTSLNILIGARGTSSPSDFFKGDIGQTLIIDRSLSLAERQNLMRSLAAEYGVSLT